MDKKIFLGIDPGKSGAFVIIDEDSNILEKIVTPLIGKEYDKKVIKEILTAFPYHHIGLEKPTVIFGVGKTAVASLSHCVGLFEGMLMGLGLRHSMIHPKTWQKEMWSHVPKQYKVSNKGGKKRKSTDTKATSLLAANNLWPNEDFRKSNRAKKPHDGIVDALLISEFVKRIYG